MSGVNRCLECGNDVPTSSKATEFCSVACKNDWNSRRKARGLQLIDLYMAHRFDRAIAQRLGVFQAINRLVSDFRAEDRERRDGRRSWREPKTVLAERPHLKGFLLRTMRIGR